MLLCRNATKLNRLFILSFYIHLIEIDYWKRKNVEQSLVLSILQSVIKKGQDLSKLNNWRIIISMEELVVAFQ